jgi:F420-dependent oxidoreductase-like protein
MKIGLMVEAQSGLTWDRWTHILGLAERLRFSSLFRSDHYFIGSQRESLEAYLSFVLAARGTSSIRFGPLVTPVMFRAPVNVGRMAAQIDVLSGGRFVMGLGAGWYEDEHRAYGIRFPPIGERFGRLEEAINLMTALWSPGRATYRGRFYQIEDVECLPRPASGRLPILIGGVGERRTLRLVAQYANEWNCFNLPPEAYSQKTAVLEHHCEAVGRDPHTIYRSMMVFGVVDPAKEAVQRPAGVVNLGQREEVVEWLGRLAELGLQEMYFQHFSFDSDELPEFLTSEIAPRAAGL